MVFSPKCECLAIRPRAASLARMNKASANDTRFKEFFAQFEADGGDYLYRYDGIGAAYRVTADEMDALFATVRQRRFWTRLTGAAAFAFLFAILSSEPLLYGPLDNMLGKGWYFSFSFVFFLFAMQFVVHLIACARPGRRCATERQSRLPSRRTNAAGSSSTASPTMI
jgi:hypothetical protein